MKFNAVLILMILNLIAIATIFIHVALSNLNFLTSDSQRGFQIKLSKDIHSDVNGIKTELANIGNASAQKAGVEEIHENNVLLKQLLNQTR